MALYLISVLALSVGVHAGSRFWEPHHDAGFITNKTSILEKRAITVNPGGDAAVAPRLWPNSEIKYCWENEESKEILMYDLQEAMNRWYAMSLPETFKWTPATASECANDRANVLFISHNTEGSLSTTNALPVIDASDNDGYVGPTMRLSSRTDVGMLDKIANYCHEIGHAWGLLHEHQHPAFWDSFSPIFKINCDALKDYVNVMNRIGNNQQLRENVCSQRDAARNNRFSAAEILPILGRNDYLSEVGTIGADVDDVDWNSIMLYPSGAGGLGNASPGNDQRRAVLERVDGVPMTTNLFPTQKDVQAIITLYGREWRRTNPPLPNQKSHPKNSLFKRIKNKFNGCI